MTYTGPGAKGGTLVPRLNTAALARGGTSACRPTNTLGLPDEHQLAPLQTRACPMSLRERRLADAPRRCAGATAVRRPRDAGDTRRRDS
jgi:hypothetical protein